MQTPLGVFEMKYFFTTALSSSIGEADHSAESVRHRIKQLVEAEQPGSVGHGVARISSRSVPASRSRGISSTAAAAGVAVAKPPRVIGSSFFVFPRCHLPVMNV